MVDPDKLSIILARHNDCESIRTIAPRHQCLHRQRPRVLAVHRATHD